MLRPRNIRLYNFLQQCSSTQRQAYIHRPYINQLRQKFFTSKSHQTINAFFPDIARLSGTYAKKNLKSAVPLKVFAGALSASLLAGLAYQLINTFGGPKDDTISPIKFSKFSLDYIQPTTSDTGIFSLSRPPFTALSASKIESWWRAGIWSVEIKQPDMQISRQYTPLPPCVVFGETWEDCLKRNKLQLQFLVKREEGGEVSNWLFRQNGSQQIEIRGPHLEYEVPPDVSEIIFLAGGTGVAPAMQVAHALQQRALQSGSDDKVPAPIQMRLAWANRHPPDLSSTDRRVLFKEQVQHPEAPKDQVLMERLRSLKDQSSLFELDVDMYCDSKAKFIKKGILSDYVSKSNERYAAAGSKGRKIILVSGPDGFVEYIAGKKPTNSPPQILTSRQTLGGLLSGINVNGWEIVKL